jgi:pilus assembly protein CpaE
MENKNTTKCIALVSIDKAFITSTKTAFSSSDSIDLITIEKSVDQIHGELHNSEAAVVIVDLDATNLNEIESLQAVMKRLSSDIPVIVITEQFNAVTVRVLIQMHVADFLEKPVTTTDLVRSCVRALKAPEDQEENNEANIYAFMPASGGVGSTTMAIQTASILHSDATHGKSTCIVDLNFQHGACAEYLDMEPRFDIAEVENNPDRLDRQLFEVMLSRHKNGIAVLAAPVSPMEMRSFNTDVVIKILDLAAAYFDNVVIDLPRTWFPWTQTVLLGANKLFIVAEKTVPCLRHTQRLLEAVKSAAGKEVSPKVIVNRYAAKSKASGIQRSDIEEVLGEHFAGAVANDYVLVNEAIDRGVLLEEIREDSQVLKDLKAIILPEQAAASQARNGFLSLPGRLFRKAG